MNSKKLIYTLLISVFIFSCSTSDSEKMTSEDLKDISADCDCAQIDFKRNAFGNKIKGSLMYDINTKEVFSGTCEEKFGDGSRKQIRQYANGELHGVIASWDDNGILRQHLNYENGKLDGAQRVWGENGRIIKYKERKKGYYTGFSWELDQEFLNLKNAVYFEGDKNGQYDYSMQFGANADGYFYFNYEKEISSLDDSTKADIKLFFDKIIKLADHEINLGWVNVKTKTNFNYEKEEKLEYEVAKFIAKSYSDKISVDTGNKHSKFFGFDKAANIKPKEDKEIKEENSIESKSVQKFKINDPDGYSNLRATPGGEIIKKVYEDERFEVLGEKDKYKEVKLEDETVGYIHESRVTMVN